MTPSVENTAIGSLLPDSNSSNGFKLFPKLMLFERKTPKTAAASVDDTIAPSKKHSKSGKFNK